MIAALILIDVAVIGALLGVAVHRATRWPTPTPRPYACVACRCDYSDPRALAWHQVGQHPNTYDGATQ